VLCCKPSVEQIAVKSLAVQKAQPKKLSRAKNMTELSKHILLVEDNDNDAELTLAMLEKGDVPVSVDVVRDGEEALDYLHRRGAYVDRPAGDPVVVLLDLKMPKVTGVEVLREVKADEKLKCIPVVMLTSSRETQDLQECYRLGANGYVVKPLEAKHFMQVITNVGAYWAATNEPPPH
jgi:CheY-like chemotaxis protein